MNRHSTPARRPAPIQVQYARQVAQLRAEVAHLQQRERRRVAYARRQRVLLQYHRHLRTLAARGVRLDVGQEMRDAARMTPQQMGRQLRAIVRHYARRPGAIVAGGGRPFTERHKNAAVRHARQTGCSWDEARAWALAHA